jgi:transaldolase
MPDDGGDADTVMGEYRKAGFDLDALARKLQVDGAAAFVKSWRELLGRIADKRRALATAR